jgi:hypothetical protein
MSDGTRECASQTQNVSSQRLHVGSTHASRQGPWNPHVVPASTNGGPQIMKAECSGRGDGCGTPAPQRSTRAVILKWRLR